MQPENSLPSSQKPITCVRPKSDQSSQLRSIQFKMYFNIILLF